MLLIKKDTFYVIKNQSENIKLEGKLAFSSGEINLDLLAFSLDDKYMGTCLYKYIYGGKCDKVIKDCNHQYINSLEQLLESTLSFLMEKFNFS